MTYLHIDELIGVLYFLKLSNFLRFTLDYICRKLRERKHRENDMDNSTFWRSRIASGLHPQIAQLLVLCAWKPWGKTQELIFTLDFPLVEGVAATASEQKTKLHFSNKPMVAGRPIEK
jgi:hypothetical protein